MEKFRNSDWLRAVQLIQNSANLCYHILAGEKNIHGKNKYGGQSSSNLGLN